MKFLDVVGSGQPKMVMPSAACAKAAYNTLYGSSTEAPKTGRRSPAFFMVHGRLVLVFSWEPALEPDLVASVVRLALLAGVETSQPKSLSSPLSFTIPKSNLARISRTERFVVAPRQAATQDLLSYFLTVSFSKFKV